MTYLLVIRCNFTLSLLPVIQRSTSLLKRKGVEGLGLASIYRNSVAARPASIPPSLQAPSWPLFTMTNDASLLDSHCVLINPPAREVTQSRRTNLSVTAFNIQVGQVRLETECLVPG